jgi:hypothetical protein
MGAGRSVKIRLLGYVTLQDVCSNVGEIWRRARQQQGLLFALDCSAVLDFSTLALTALTRLRKHLREFGCDLVLVNCSESLRERKDDALLTPLLTPLVPAAAPQPPPKKSRLAKKQPGSASTPSGPRAPHYVQRLVKTYQRYWLN